MVGMQMAYHLKGFDGTTPKVSMEQIKFLCLASLKYVEADQIPQSVLVEVVLLSRSNSSACVGCNGPLKHIKFLCLARPK